MSHSVLETSRKILQSEYPHEILRFVDQLIRTAEQQGDKFILPAAYAYLKPLLAAYIGKPKDFLQYVKAMRDEARLDDDLDAAADIQKFFRVLETREAQRARRERVAAAVAWLEKTYPTASTDQKHRWVKRLEQQWSKKRSALLKAWRDGHRTRVPEDVRRELLDDFWSEVEGNISRGDLPPLE